VWTGWHLWAAAVNKAGSVDRGKVTAVLESGLQWTAPEGRVKLDPQTHHLVHSVNLARVNGHHGSALGDGRGIDPWRESPHVIRGRAGEGDLGGSGVQIGLNRQQ
jgi:branched-chain amino acid transport system substrate-binding protein